MAQCPGSSITRSGANSGNGSGNTNCANAIKHQGTQPCFEEQQQHPGSGQRGGYNSHRGGFDRSCGRGRGCSGYNNHSGHSGSNNKCSKSRTCGIHAGKSKKQHAHIAHTNIAHAAIPGLASTTQAGQEPVLTYVDMPERQPRSKSRYPHIGQGIDLIWSLDMEPTPQRIKLTERISQATANIKDEPVDTTPRPIYSPHVTLLRQHLCSIYLKQGQGSSKRPRPQDNAQAGPSKCLSLVPAAYARSTSPVWTRCVYHNSDGISRASTSNRDEAMAYGSEPVGGNAGLWPGDDHECNYGCNCKELDTKLDTQRNTELNKDIANAAGLSTYDGQVAVLSHQRGHKESLSWCWLGEPDYILHE
jgi:hypothetical protein